MTKESLIKNPRTTAGGVLMLAGVGLLAAHCIDIQTAIVIFGLAGGWLGIAGKDGNQGSTKSNERVDAVVKQVEEER